jgi:hypothetical protein
LTGRTTSVAYDVLFDGNWLRGESLWMIEETGSVSMLPNVVAGPIGLAWDVQQKLAAMNDSGKTFKQIAAWINRYL